MPAPSAPLPQPRAQKSSTPGTLSSVLLLRNPSGAPAPSLGVPFCSLRRPLPVAQALVVI